MDSETLLELHIGKYTDYIHKQGKTLPGNKENSGTFTYDFNSFYDGACNSITHMSNQVPLLKLIEMQ